MLIHINQSPVRLHLKFLKSIMKIQFKFIRTLFYFGVVAALSYACSNAQQQGGPGAVKQYPVQKLSYQSATVHQIYPATIEGVQTVELRSQIQGYLDEIYVDEGAWVKKGETLFRIYANDYAQQVKAAEASVQAMKAQVKTAQLNVEKQEPLVKKEIISEYTLSISQQSLESAKADLAQAEAQLEDAKTNLAYSVIKSPSDGVIGTIPYRIGSLVSSTMTQPLTVISDIRQVRVYFSVNEKDYLSMTHSSLADFVKGKGETDTNIVLLLPNGEAFEHNGHIDAISGVIDASTGSATFRATFENPDLRLRSGGSARVKIPEQADSIFIVPQAATYEIQNKRFIYVVNDSNTVNPREIQAYADDNGKDFIVTKGLKPNETIVVDGINSLTTGAKIEPQLQK